MMSSKAVKFAVSALAIGTTMVACKPAAQAYRPNSASAQTPKAEREAIAAYARAHAAVQKGALSEALAHAEQAVALAPRDSGYRMLLGDLYLKNGRFQSAETSFGDVLELDPGNPRAQLSMALSQIALGRTASALVRLDRLAETAAPGDIGLAYALAGQPQRAIELLEPAAREAGATGRVRQNLALAYALAGDWQKARVTAAQDVSPAELSGRLQQWASFAQPKASWDQVASLLNVTPAEDPGQPVRLALAPPAPAPSAFAAAAAPAPEPEPGPVVAAAAPAVVPHMPIAASAPVEIAVAQIPPSISQAPIPVLEPTVAEATPEAEQESAARPLYADAVQALVTAQPAVLAAAPAVQATEPRFEAAPKAAPQAEQALPKPRKAVVTSPGRFAVQLGAFSSPAGVERAWASAFKRYGFADRTPLTTTVSLAGKGTFHRLSVGGFASHAEASRVCRSVKAKGGACFVRSVAGDAPTRWAGRYTGRRA